MTTGIDRLTEIGHQVLGYQHDKVKKAREVREKIQPLLFRQPGVTAIDIGFMINQTEDKFTDEVAVRVHVENKFDPAGLKALFGRKSIAELHYEQFVEKGSVAPPLKARQTDPSTTVRIKGIPIDIIEASYLPSATFQVEEPKVCNEFFHNLEVEAYSRTPINNLVGGASLGTARGPAGTLGAVVWDRTDGTPCILSNWHVLAGDLSATAGLPCYQPALFDGGTAEHEVGHLKRWHFGIHGDAALAELNGERPYAAGEILGLWAPVVDIVEPKLGMPVRKWGRSTGFTKGFIDGIDLTINIDYRQLGTQRFEDQIHIAARRPGEELSGPGDSGCLWLTKFTPSASKDEVRPAERYLIPGRTELQKQRNNEIDQKLQRLAQAIQDLGPANIADEFRDIEPLKCRVYYAVGLNFAGDVPGIKSGEFAVASRLCDLAHLLNFSMRPVFFPHSGLVARGEDHSTARRDRGRNRDSHPAAARGGGFVGPAAGRGQALGGPVPTADPERP